MKTIIAILIALLLPLGLRAQDGKYDATNEIRGSGRIIRETVPLNAVDQVVIEQFPASVTIITDTTKASVSISINDNLRSMIGVKNEKGTLTLSFSEPKGQWINKATIIVVVNAPQLTNLRHRSNGDLLVKGLRGGSFNLTNEANGTVTMLGRLDTLNLVCQANGTVNADQLPVQVANIVTQANATIRVNARTLNQVNAGNATVINQIYTPGSQR